MSRDDFAAISAVLFEDIVGRVLVQMALTLFLVPVVSTRAAQWLWKQPQARATLSPYCSKSIAAQVIAAVVVAAILPRLLWFVEHVLARPFWRRDDDKED